MSGPSSPRGTERVHALAALDTAKRLLQYALLLGLSRAEAVAYLHRTAGLQPALTELVWDKLAAQNEEYFADHAKRVSLRKACCASSHAGECHATGCCCAVAAFLAASPAAQGTEEDSATSSSGSSHAESCGFAGQAARSPAETSQQSAQLA